MASLSPGSPASDPGPRGRRDGLAEARTASPSPGVRWLLLVGGLVPLVLLADAACRTLLGEGTFAPLLAGIGIEAWALLGGIAVATAHAARRRPVPRPAPLVEHGVLLIPVLALGLQTDLRALDGDAGVTMVVGAVVALFVLVVALAGWSLRLSLRLTLLVIAGVLAGILGAATVGALSRRAASRAAASRAGREVALIAPLVVLLPLLLVGVVVAVAVRWLPGPGSTFVALALGDVSAVVGTTVSGDGSALASAVRGAIALPVVAALALGVIAAEQPGVAPASSDGGTAMAVRRPWSMALVGGGVLAAGALVGTAVVAGAPPPEVPGPLAHVILAVPFLAIGFRAPVRTSGPWSPKLGATVAIAAAWLLLLAAIAALAVSGRP